MVQLTLSRQRSSWSGFFDSLEWYLSSAFPLILRIGARSVKWLAVAHLMLSLLLGRLRSINGKKSTAGGANLIAVLVALAIGAAVLNATMTMMGTAFSASKHVSLDDEINFIKRTIGKAIDCRKTLALDGFGGVLNLSSGDDCDPSKENAKSILLRDRNGVSFTGPLEVEGTFKNAGRGAGTWYLRSRCDRVNHTLVIQAARIGGGRNSFANDPLTKRTYDFTESNQLLLFGCRAGGDCNRICQENLGGSSSHWVDYPVDATATGINNYCRTSSGSGDCRDIASGIIGGATGQWAVTRDNRSPSEVCVDAGFEYFTGACTATNVDGLGAQGQGTLSCNNAWNFEGTPRWSCGCVWGGAPNVAVPKMISCN